MSLLGSQSRYSHWQCIYSHLRNLGRGLFFFLKHFSTRIIIASSVPVRLPWEYAHCVRNEDAEGTTVFVFPDAIIIALLGKYRSFCTELVASSVLWSDWPINLIWCLYEYHWGLNLTGFISSFAALPAQFDVVGKKLQLRLTAQPSKLVRLKHRK